jgi:hypothetical protein
MMPTKSKRRPGRETATAAEWRDESSYGRGERGTDPRVWELRPANGLRIVVHRYTGCDYLWFVSCVAARLDTRQLRATDIAEAKAEALSLVRSQIAVWHEAMERLTKGG